MSDPITVDISDLVGKLPAIAGNQEALIQLIAQKMALDALTGVVLATPVDKGRARGGWTVEIGSETAGDSATLDKTGSGTISAGSAKITSAKPFEPISISNNVPYIGILNGGSSKQAPAQFVELAVAAATKL